MGGGGGRGKGRGARGGPPFWIGPPEGEGLNGERGEAGHLTLQLAF